MFSEYRGDIIQPVTGEHLTRLAPSHTQCLVRRSSSSASEYLSVFRFLARSVPPPHIRRRCEEKHPSICFLASEKRKIFSN
ncbi:hypothetical protein F2P81_004810 [Scophthalmus maximus]|uniref:Uncharacterized protein n=1 Tax=Scophthalmus maximus TaxID=52904 RepID=A0A6A4TBU4_SCOMX|nr:hypothetical protein F2P81_004810 [Scophthalmus maximus]